MEGSLPFLLLPEGPQVKSVSVYYAQGKPHVCKKGNFSNNIESLIKKRSPKTKSNLTSALLKNVVTESEKDLRGVSISLKSGSKCLPVTVGTPKVQTKKVNFTHESLIRLQTKQNLSDKTIK